MPATFNVLAISGSVRANSTNLALLQAIQRYAPDEINIDLYSSLDTLPIFSPDLEEPHRPENAMQLIDLINSADGLIISSPEYVRAIPGGLKNAIDWLVSDQAIINKPIALVHASHRGDDMLASLRLVLSTVSSAFQQDIFLHLPLMSMSTDEISNHLAENTQRTAILNFLNDFRTKCRST